VPDDRQQYEANINRLNGQIAEAQRMANYWQRDKESNFRSTCAGFDYGECDKWKVRQAEIRDERIRAELDKAEKYKQEIWDYQKEQARLEQDAQVEAVRQAIADQVRLEQERIQQSQQNQIIMEQAPPAEPPSEPSAIIEPGKPEPIATIEPGNNLTEANILPGDFKLPFHHNYLIPIIAIGGYLVLRS